MIKKIQPFSKSYKMPYLCLDDLFCLEDILKESNPKNYRVETENSIYESVREISQSGELIHELDFRISEPYFHLSFDERSATMHTYSGDLNAVGLISKIDSYLLPKQRKQWWIFIMLNSFVGPSLFLLSLLFGIITWKSGELMFSLVLFAIAICTAVSICLCFTGERDKYSTIELSMRVKKKGYFERNKDQLTNTLFGVLLGAVVTYVLTKL